MPVVSWNKSLNNILRNLLEAVGNWWIWSGKSEWSFIHPDWKQNAECETSL